MNITVNGKSYSIQKYKPTSNSFTDRVISFCQKWLTAQEEFEINTSGSTGTPKKIVIKREALKQSAAATSNALDLISGETAFVCLDPNYIGGMMMLVRSLEVGMNILAEEPSANPFSNLPINTKIDFIALVPYQLKGILQTENKRYFKQIKNILIGGAPLDQVTIKELQIYKSQFYETYGMTETISHIALKKINGKYPSTYFKCLSGITIRQDERACLCIGAPYLVDEIITNDVVELKNLDEFIWLGRFDNVINSGGVKIFPESTEKKIESVFLELKIQKRFFIAGLPDLKLGEAVTLVIESNSDASKITELTEKLKANLHKYEIPKSIKMVDKFIEAGNNKINRKKTLELLT